MAQRARRDFEELLDVRLAGIDEVPVGDVEERRHAVDGDVVRVDLVQEHHRVDADGGEHHEQRGQQPARASNPERSEREAPGAFELVDEQARDQEPAEHEEQVDAEEAARGDARREVVEDHREHGDAAQPVEGTDVPHAGRGNGGRRSGRALVGPRAGDSHRSSLRTRLVRDGLMHRFSCPNRLPPDKESGERQPVGASASRHDQSTRPKPSGESGWMQTCVAPAS